MNAPKQANPSFGHVKISVKPDLSIVTLISPNNPLLAHLFKVAELDPIVADGLLTAGGPVGKDETLGGVLFSYTDLLRAGGWTFSLHLGALDQTASMIVSKALDKITIRFPNNAMIKALLAEEDITFADPGQDADTITILEKVQVIDPPTVRKGPDGLEKDHGDVLEKIGIWADFFRDMGMQYDLLVDSMVN